MHYYLHSKSSCSAVDLTEPVRLL